MEAMDLTALVPPNANQVLLRYRVDPPEGEARLYRARNDQQPIPLQGRGAVVVGLLEPQTLLYDTVANARLTLEVAGYGHEPGGVFRAVRGWRNGA